jgi:hypothetical protein
MEKQGGIYARYTPGRDRDQTSTTEAQVTVCPHYTYPTPKLPTIHDTLLHTPEMQKAAVSGLIEEIVVQPTAALEMQCSFQFFLDRISLRGIEPRFDGCEPPVLTSRR